MSGNVLLDRVKAWARRLKMDVIALWLAARDPRVPLAAKLVAAAVAAYALSPVDLIPDFVPVLGYIDDLLIVPAGIWLAARLVPPALMDELRAKAAQRHKPRSFAGLLIVVTVWIGAVLLAWKLSALP